MASMVENTREKPIASKKSIIGNLFGRRRVKKLKDMDEDELTKRVEDSKDLSFGAFMGLGCFCVLAMIIFYVPLGIQVTLMTIGGAVLIGLFFTAFTLISYLDYLNVSWYYITRFGDLP